MGAFIVVFMIVRVVRPRRCGSDHPFFFTHPLSATAWDNNVESSINRVSVELNIRFEFSAMRELAQKVGGVRH